MSDTQHNSAKSPLMPQTEICRVPFSDSVLESLVTGLENELGGNKLHASSFRDNHRVWVCPEKLQVALVYLRRLGMDFLVDLSAADYLNYPGAEHRYGVWYLLENTTNGCRLTIRTWVNDPDPVLASAFDIWRGSDWMEREIYDMFGIVFQGHPDLRRILLPDEFAGHPLRKDYPLRGPGERHHFVPLARDES